MKIVLLGSQLVGKIIEMSQEIGKIEKSLLELRSVCDFGEVKFQRQKLGRRVSARDHYVEVAMRHANTNPKCPSNVRFDLDRWMIVPAGSDPGKQGCKCKCKCKQKCNEKLRNESQRKAEEESAARKIRRFIKSNFTRKVVKRAAKRNLVVTKIQSGIRRNFARRAFIKIKIAILNL